MKFHASDIALDKMMMMMILILILIQVGGNEWRAMRRAFGAVFDILDAPHQPIIVRLQLIGRAGRYLVESKSAIPRDWKIGASYDTQLHI